MFLEVWMKVGSEGVCVKGVGERVGETEKETQGNRDTDRKIT